MGFHKKLRDLYPVVYYTFDPRETYGDVYEGIGDYGNKVETEFPNLRMYNTGLTWTYPGIPFVVPSLATIEKSSLYKAASNGKPHILTLNAHRFTDSSSSPFNINASSMYYEAELSNENLEELKRNGEYTIFFQLQAHHSPGYNRTLFGNLYKEYLEPRSVFGYNMHVRLSTTRTFDEDITIGVSFLNSVQVAENLVTADFHYGVDSCAELFVNNVVDPNKVYGYESGILFHRDIMFDESEMNNIYFKFGYLNLFISTSSDSPSSFLYGFEKLTNIDTRRPFSYYSSDGKKPVKIAIIVNEELNSYRAFVDKVDLGYFAIEGGVIDKTIFYSNKICLGYKSTWDKMDVSQERIKDFILDEHSYIRKYNFPKSVVMFDNFAMYDYALSEEDIIKLNDIDMTQEDFYRERDFVQLYKFDTLYNKSTRYIENETMIPNSLGTSYLYSFSTNKRDLPYVKRYETNPEIDYSFVLKSNATLMTNRNFTDYYSSRNPIPLLRSQNGTLTFYFKTTDEHGVLFFNGRYEHSARNLMMVFSYGFLEIWHSNELQTRISGFNNGEWHAVDIIYTLNTLNIYINNTEYVTRNVGIGSDSSMAGFGNCVPGNNGLDMELSKIAYSSRNLNLQDLKEVRTNALIYSASGQVTLNNIALGTVVFIYNRDTGALIERLTTSNEDGTFTYYNKTPYTLTVIVADSSLTQGTSYILDPIELQ